MGFVSKSWDRLDESHRPAVKPSTPPKKPSTPLRQLNTPPKQPTTPPKGPSTPPKRLSSPPGRSASPPGKLSSSVGRPATSPNRPASAPGSRPGSSPGSLSKDQHGGSRWTRVGTFIELFFLSISLLFDLRTSASLAVPYGLHVGCAVNAAACMAELSFAGWLVTHCEVWVFADRQTKLVRLVAERVIAVVLSGPWSG